MFKKIAREYFLLTRGEQRGLITVASLLIITSIIRLIVISVPERDLTEIDSFLVEAGEIFTMMEQLEAIEEDKTRFTVEEKGDPKPEIFDPNTISIDDLFEMHIPRFVASNIIKYRNAGGWFSKPEDLAKIYGMDSSLFSVLLPYIDIDQEIVSEQIEYVDSNHYSIGVKHPLTIIELNGADSAALILLPGIGPGYAKRIIKYRSLLGGFIEIGQLNEVYGLESYPVNEIEQMVAIDTSLICYLDINSASYVQLLRHPYLTRSEVLTILQYRDFAGEIGSIKEVYKNVPIDSSNWKKIKKYLVVGNIDTSKAEPLQ